MPLSAVALTPEHRAHSLQRMAHEVFEVLVIGGGVVGTGVALDAATRGLTVALVEQRDYASGTSSRSSKLIHGGLRYLEQYDFGLVREALRERALLLRTLCPHLVHPVQFLFPLRTRVVERAYVGAGVLLYDLLAGVTGAVPRHRHLSRRRALQIAPALKEDSLIGAIQYYDAQVDDARHTMMIARTAATYGAALATSARVTGLLRDGERVTGAQVRDLESGDDLEVRANHVINATGVWSDDVLDMLGGRNVFEVRPSKGIHIVIPRDRLRLETGLITKTEKSVLFVIPWGSHWLVGTTDTDWSYDRAHPAATSSDIEYVLDHLNEWVADPVTADDIEGVYAGLRPLVAEDPSAGTTSISREHSVVQPVDGLTIIAGGKYTTYRVMAKDAVDAAARALDQAVPESVTTDIRIVGAEGYPALRNGRSRLAARSGLHVAVIDHLLGRYGALIADVLALIAERPELAEPLPGADEYLGAEVVYAARAEAALHLEDVMARRTRISFEVPAGGLEAAETVAGLMAGELGWDDETRDRELELYRERVEAEQAAHREKSDADADAMRTQASEARAGAV
ncbi:MAG: glycerol-3-phosphate dehydrogenase/oxidase [Actinobacteria bacterium]|nr:glycerol-3-phosphate dehydrogenase/oxidase [Actinomycetota bacterium]